MAAKPPKTALLKWPHQHKPASEKQIEKANQMPFDARVNIVVHALVGGTAFGLTAAELSAAVILDLIGPLSATTKVGIRPTGRRLLARRIASDAAALVKLHAQ